MRILNMKKEVAGIVAQALPLLFTGYRNVMSMKDIILEQLAKTYKQ